jgi:predicted esterase
MPAGASLGGWDALERVEQLASAGQNDAALSLLGRCVDHGVFWHPYLLRSWLPSLALHPTLLGIQYRMDQLRSAADATARARVRIVNANQATTARAIVLLLHGGGGDIDELRMCGDLPNEERIIVALAQSSQHVAPGCFGWVELARSIDDLATLERQIRAMAPVVYQPIVIGGYSQGGHLAIIVAVTQQPFSTQGFISFGVPTDILPGPLDLVATHGTLAVRGWLGLGEDERPWRVTQAEQMVQVLASRGVQCHLERIANLGHAIPVDCSRQLREGIRFVLDERRRMPFSPQRSDA